MADSKLSALALATPAPADYLYVVDTSDTSDSPQGSSRKALLSALRGALGISYKLFDHYTDSGNSGTSETDLYTAAVAGGTLGASGDGLEAFYSLSVTGSATATTQIKVYFAGTARFDSGALSLTSSGNWQVYVGVVRTGTTTGRISVALQTAGASISLYSQETDMTSLDFTAANVLKVTATRAGAGAATNDVVAKHGWVVKLPAAA